MPAPSCEARPRVTGGRTAWRERERLPGSSCGFCAGGIVGIRADELRSVGWELTPSFPSCLRRVAAAAVRRDFLTQLPEGHLF